MLRSSLIALILLLPSLAHADDTGLALGARIGVTSIAMDSKINPYVSPGATFGASIGWAFARPIALNVVYEWSSVGRDERNASASPGHSHLLGLAARLRSNPPEHAGLYFEPLFALRTVSYHFYRNDGFTGNAWELPSGETAEATLRGWELRFALGISAPVTRAFSIDTFMALGTGRMLHYSDSLDCATFQPGSCGSHYRFSSTTLGLYVAANYH